MRVPVRGISLCLAAVFAAGVCCAQISISAVTSNNTSASASYLKSNPYSSAYNNVSKLPITSLLYPGATTKVYVRFMPWFGEKNHTLAGYESDDQRQVSAQINDMMSRGISGAFIAWYGQKDAHKDSVTTRFMKEAERDGFQFALSYSGTLDSCAKTPGCDVTEAIVSEMNYAAGRFMQSPAYVKVNGRPVFFIFDLSKYSIDWGRVRREAQGQPIILFRNPGGFRHESSDGAYAWLEPGGSNGSDPVNIAYLERFYSAAGQNRDKLVIGSAYKGFDDSRASWGKNRHVPEQCGLTWLQTFAEINQHYSPKNQLPMLLIVTWNDYEEGTEIETGIDNCVSVTAQMDGDNLKWNVSGDERTVDHYRILATSDGKTATDLEDIAAGQGHKLNVAHILGRGRWTVYVEAIGRASMLNHLSNPVQITGQ